MFILLTGVVLVMASFVLENKSLVFVLVSQPTKNDKRIALVKHS